MREWMMRLLDWIRRDRLDRELTDELAFHRQLLERDARAEGADAAESPRLAARRLGNVTRTRETARERWSIPLLDHLHQDLRYALRGLRRSPAFTITVIVTLGLGIGANAAMFTVVDRLMFRPLAYLRDPATVHRFYWQRTDGPTVTTTLSGPYTRYLDLRRETTAFAQLAAFSELDLAVGEGAATRERRVGAISASFFDFFDARPVLGRFFADDEDVTPRGADVAVLSHALWQSEYGARDVQGERLQVGNVRATIIGVAPPGFSGVNDANPPAVFIPITTYAGSQGTADAQTYFSRYYWGWVHVLVRRKPDITLARAEQDATEAFRRSWIAAKADNPSWANVDAEEVRVAVSSVRPGAGPDPTLEVRTARWLSAVAGIVLLIACANVTNLVLARRLRRARETAVRLALGVHRGRLARQHIVESLMLALAGGAAALLVSHWAARAIRGLLLAGTPEAAPILSDGRTLGITTGLAVAAGLLIGVVPALIRERGDLARALRSGVRETASDGRGIRSLLMVAQAALSVVLLVGAVLFVRSLVAVKNLPMGYDADRVLLVRRIIRGPFPSESAHLAMRQVLLSTAQAIPGVEAAAWVSSAPFVSTSNTALFVAGIDSVGRLGTFTYQATTADYFRVMGTRIVRGRGLLPGDGPGAPAVAVVSESMARVLWPGQDPIGQCFRMREATAPCTFVVGVAQDMVQRDLLAAQRFHYYLPAVQFTRTYGTGMLLRVRGDPARESERIRQELQRVIPGESYVTVRPLRDVVRNEQRSWRLGATLFVAFGALALIVAAVGLYGVIGYNVTQRLPELGVRAALGASRSAIVRLVVGQSIRIALTGVGLGLLVAVAGSRWVQPLLFDTSATDPVTYAMVAATMIWVALLAGAVPAMRAARADPTQVLRAE